MAAAGSGVNASTTVVPPDASASGARSSVADLAGERFVSLRTADHYGGENGRVLSRLRIHELPRGLRRSDPGVGA